MKKYNITTIGCQMNKSDSERIAGYLEQCGLKSTNNDEETDIAVITTCGVRQSAENRIYGLIPKFKRANPDVKIVFTGCLSERSDIKKKLADKVDVWLPIRELPTLGFMLGLEKKVADDRNKDYLKISPNYNSRISAFVPIGNGCNNYCTYCVVPYARGPEVYRDAGDILDEVKSLINKDYKEVILIAQNVNSYNDKKKNNFADLLTSVNSVEGNFRIRFATSHPKDMSEDVIMAIARCEKVCKHVHLPAQAGDNEIIKAMNRKYTVEHYKQLISQIKNKCKINNGEWQSPVAISTDIIVGFPGETRGQFENTVKLFKEVKFDMAYVAQYSPRPGTAAADLEDDVSREEKKRREEELMKILRQTVLENNKEYLNREVEILIEGRNKKGEWFGKTGTNKNVRVADCGRRIADFVGSFERVKISAVKDFGLSGEIINQL